MTPTDFYALIFCTLVPYLVFTEIRGYRQRRANRAQAYEAAAAGMERHGNMNWEVRLK